jgi:peptidase M28-like protein
MASDMGERRRRPRRGSLQRPVSSRIYRAGFAGVVVALLVAAFTVGRLDPLPEPKLDPSFDEASAVQFASDFARVNPSRTPGSTGAVEASRWVTERLSDYGLKTHRQVFRARIVGLGERELVNLITIVPGRSPEAIVVLAHRDNLGISPGANDNGSGTGALLELARNVASTSLSHTLVLVSTDGGAFGGIGADALARDPEVLRQIIGGKASIAAVVNLDDLGGAGPPRLLFSGETARTAAAALVATASESIREQTREEPEAPAALSQLIDLAFPFSLYEHAPFVARGIPAITLTTSGVRPPRAETDTIDRLRGERLGLLGRSAQSLIASLDGAPEVASGTQSYLALGSRFLRGWTIQFLFLMALLPFVATVVDLFARSRRRHVPLLPALRSLRSRVGVWLWAGLVFALFSALGAFPSGAARPINPDAPVVGDWPYIAIVGVGVVSILGWLVARPRLARTVAAGEADELGGYLAALLGLGMIALVVAASNPFALLFVLPSLHAWLWLPQIQDRPLPARIALFAAGFVGPLLLFLSFAGRYDLGVDTLWYLPALVSVGYVPLPLLLATLGWGAVAAQIGALALGRYAPYPAPDERSVRGPIRETIRRIVLLSRSRSRARELEQEEPQQLRSVDPS